MNKHLFLAIFMAVMLLFGFNVTKAEEPIMRFGVMSDLHSQMGDISGDVSAVKLRGTIGTVLQKMKEQENLDLLVLNGDYTSDVTIPEANWNKVKELMVAATRKAFNGSKSPVLYVAGNHEYEVANFDKIPKPYNAANFYETPMKTDVGELADSECFYENADNGVWGNEKLLAAYHYVINGFDFVALNCGKNFFTSAWDYQYSQESVQWVADKLAEIYASNANKTVFFLAHMPFADSKSMSSTSKGLSDVASTKLLKSTLAKYPNLIHIYGHDHGSDNAYIRTETAQRVTQYDTNGNVYSAAPAPAETNEYTVTHAITGKWLGRQLNVTDNMTTMDTERIIKIASSATAGKYILEMVTDSPEKYVQIGSSGRWSGNKSELSDVWLYKVTSSSNGTYVATAYTDSPVADEKYLVVGDKSGVKYALSNEPYSSGTGYRLVGKEVTISNGTITYVDANTTDNYSCIWNFAKKASTPAETAKPSFISAFDGSMRYYSNSFDPSSKAEDSAIAQALMVYVYSDRIELQMKNYAATGDINGTGIVLASTPAPYVITREVIGSGEPTTPTSATVTLPATVTGGTLSVTSGDKTLVAGANTVDNGAVLTITATPDAEHQLPEGGVTVNGTPLVGNSYTVTGDTEIAVNFTALPTYCTVDVNNAHKERRMESVTLSDGTNSVIASGLQPTSGTAVYVNKTDKVLVTKAGAEITITNDWKGEWMHGYAYIDYDNDKTFNTTLNAAGENAGELVSYTYYDVNEASTGKNSLGEDAIKSVNANGPMPKFTIPANLPGGDYRLRVKVDWNNLDPCSRTVDPNAIQANGGAIIDMTVRVIPTTSVITLPETVTGGTLSVTTGNQALVPGNNTVKIGSELIITATPDDDHQLLEGGITVNGTPLEGNTYTVATDAAIAIAVNFTALPEYCSVDVNITNPNSRRLESLSITDGKSTLNATGLQPTYTSPVYVNKVDQILETEAGAEITITSNWTGSWMHGYAYIDYDKDRTFNTTVNAAGDNKGELVSYTYYDVSEAQNGKNSLGETVYYGKDLNEPMPKFTIPANLPAGDYRLRYKIDWNSLDPCSRTTAPNAIQANGGAIIDMTIRIVSSVATVTYDGGSDETGGTFVVKNAEGEVVTSGTGLAKGAVLSVETTPATDCQLKSIKVNDVALEAGKTTFTLSGNSTVTVAFTKPGGKLLTYNSYTGGAIVVTATKDGSEEVVIANGEEYPTGSTLKLTFVPEPYYALTQFMIIDEEGHLQDLSSSVVDNTYTMTNVTYNLVAAAAFAKQKFTVDYTCTGEGTLKVTAAGAAVNSGATVDGGTVLKIEGTPSSDLSTLTKFTINGEDKKADMLNGTMDYTVAANVTIVAEYFVQKFAVNCTITGEGTVTVVDDNKKEYALGSATIPTDSYITLKLTPATDYALQDIKLEGVSVLADVTDNVYDYGYISSDLNFAVDFKYLSGVGANQLGNVTINYSNNIITVSGLNQGESYSIYDMLGHKVILSDKAQLNVGELAEGCYIVKVESVNGVKTLKFIKK